MAADRPFTRQYDLFAGGLNGVPAALLPLSVLQTNENYMVVRSFPFAMLFSRGGFLTNASQAGKNEKTLMAVFLVPVKVCSHPAGIAGINVQAMLDGERFRKVGQVAALQWGQTFTFQTAARPHKLTVRAELCASWDVAEEGEEPDLVPEAPDSPPPFTRAGPVNFYES
jgi:hypothetical protein